MTSRDHLLFEEPRWPGLVRHGAAAALVVLVVAPLAVAFSARPPSRETSDVDDAVMIDLPSALSSTGVAAEANGPEPPAAPDTPPTPPPAPALPDVPPPAAAAEPAPPPPVATPLAPATTAQVATAPVGVETPTRQDDASGETETAHASANALSIWQRAMVARLAAAKRGLHAGGRHGTAIVAFTVGARGQLVEAAIARSSGDTGLDAAAERLIQAAAPFPPPPPGTGDLAFDLPIHFKP